MTEFGEQLRIRRVVAGLSRVKLGRLAGLSECTIKLLEKGKSQPTEKTLLRLLGTKKLRLLLTDLSEPDCHRMRKYFWTGKKDYARPGNAAQRCYFSESTGGWHELCDAVRDPL